MRKHLRKAKIVMQLVGSQDFMVDRFSRASVSWQMFISRTRSEKHYMLDRLRLGNVCDWLNLLDQSCTSTCEIIFRMP